MTRRSFGAIKKLPSGRFHASYKGPDGRRYNGPTTYGTRKLAETWLGGIDADIQAGKWVSPRQEREIPTVRDYADTWLANRNVRDRTRRHYRWILDKRVLPTFGDDRLDEVELADVREWYTGMADVPAIRVHAYTVLHSIMDMAVEDELITRNPCRIKKGTKAEPKDDRIRVLEYDEYTRLLDAITDETFRALVIVTTWCALRWGEVSELRRADVDLTRGVIHITRAVGRYGDVARPKSKSGTRDVSIPEVIVDDLKNHMAERVGPEPDALLFPATDGGHLPHSTMTSRFKTAAKRAGVTNATFHDLRHTGATIFAQAGGNVRDVMDRLGHSKAEMSLRYIHTAQARQAKIANQMGDVWRDSA